MIYTKEHIDEVVSKYLTIHEDLSHSKLATVIQTAGDLADLSHRQLRGYISTIRGIKKEEGTGNVLVIGDLHAPFTLKGYLEFCVYLYVKYKCDRVVFIGDITDQHSNSYHEHDPDGLSAGDELFYAKRDLKPWFEAFPNADVLMGNHDLLISRKAKSAGLSKHVLKAYSEVIGAPDTWIFHNDELVIDDVIYTHGSVGEAIVRAKDSRQSVVQGHLHTKAYVQWSVSNKDAIFGVQTGCGIDRHKYAMAYASQNAKKPVISAAIILDRGKVPVIELMPL